MVNLRHPVTGLTKQAPTGYSWWTFFFGFFVSLRRGMTKETLAMILLFPVQPIPNIYYSFTINKAYATKLIEDGYVPCTELDQHKLREMGIEISFNFYQDIIKSEQVAS